MAQQPPPSPRTAAISTYRAVTSISTDEEARTHLEAADWNLEAAVSNFLDSSETSSREQTPPPPSSQVPLPAPAAPRMRWLMLICSPLRAIWTLFSQLTQTLIRILSGPAQAIEASPGQSATARFRAYYDEKYGIEHPEFFEGSYEQALLKASEELKILIVYLHSDAHRMTRRFCREVLADEEFRQQCEECIFWALSVNQREGAAVMRGLGVHGLPFLGAVIWNGRVVGEGEWGNLVGVGRGGGWLERVKGRQRETLEGWRRERVERESARLLREEQDLEFQRSLEEDRKRERERERERERIEGEKRKEEEREMLRVRKMEELGEEVEKGPGVVSLALRLPDGRKVERRFEGEERMEKVFDWALVQRVDLNVACLVSSWPRRRFVWPKDGEGTIREAGLFPSAVLVLEERDDVGEEQVDKML